MLSRIYTLTGAAFGVGGLLGGLDISSVNRSTALIGRPDSVLSHARGRHMGSRGEWTRILGLEGFRVQTIEWTGDGPSARIWIRIERRGIRGYECSGCRRRSWRVRDRAERTWDDLHWPSTP